MLLIHVSLNGLWVGALQISVDLYACHSCHWSLIPTSVLATCLIGIFSETRIFEITNPKCLHDNFSVKSISNSINVINVVLLYLRLTDLAAVH